MLRGVQYRRAQRRKMRTRLGRRARHLMRERGGAHDRSRLCPPRQCNSGGTQRARTEPRNGSMRFMSAREFREMNCHRERKSHRRSTHNSKSQPQKHALAPAAHTRLPHPKPTPTSAPPNSDPNPKSGTAGHPFRYQPVPPWPVPADRISKSAVRYVDM
jgi:hypothetical protein